MTATKPMRHLDQWCESYLDAKERAEGTETNIYATIKLLDRFMGLTIRVGRVTVQDARMFRDWLENPILSRTQRSPATVGLHLTNARAIFAHALRGGAIKSNPFLGVRPTGIVRQRPWHYVDMHEFETVLAALPGPEWRNLFALCRLAGLRLGKRGGEAMALKWTDIKGQRIEVVDHKRGKMRSVPMSRRLREILNESTGDDFGDLVCPITNSGMDRKLKVFINRAGVPVWSKPFHTLRKSCESDWLAMGIPVSTVAHWMGHSPRVALTYYAQPTPDQFALITG